MGNNKYVPYHEESRAYAQKLAKQTNGTLLSIYRAITTWADSHIAYDYLKAMRVKKENPKALPDVETTWKTRMGICADISALVVGMLQACGIRAYLCYGYAKQPDRNGQSYHAWVEAVVNGRTYRYDHEAKGRKVTYRVTHRF